MTPYTVSPFPRIRQATIEVLRAARRKNMVHSFIEVDVSGMREQLRGRKRSADGYVSFTGYLLFHIARAVERYPGVHAYRKGRNHLVVFDDVDICTTIEREYDGHKIVVARVVRAANRKSTKEISSEILDESRGELDDAAVYRMIRLLLCIPGFLRGLAFRLLERFPQVMKRQVGTVMVTSMPMRGTGAVWGLPIAGHTVNVTVGGVVSRMVEREGKAVLRDFLCMTLSFDHDIVDGAPAARFLRHLIRRIERSGSPERSIEPDR